MSRIDPDVARYALAETVLTTALSSLIVPGMKANHVVAGMAHALRNIGVPEHEIRSSLAAVLLIGTDGKVLPASAGHADVDHAHALMSLPPGSVSRGGAS